MTIPDNAIAAKALLEADGWTVVRTKSYHAARERQRVAEARVRWAERDIESAQHWAREVLAGERRLAQRCSYLYGLAAALGATDEQLRGEGSTDD